MIKITNIDNKIIDKDFVYKGATYITRVQAIISAFELQGGSGTGEDSDSNGG